MDKNSEAPVLTAELAVKMAWCLGLALYFVVFLWGFWDRGPFALGLNTSIFTALVLLLFQRTLRKENNFCRHDLLWMIPLLLIALSYSLYNNPFVKAANMLLFPALVALFINYGFLANKTKRAWDFEFVRLIVARALSFLAKIGTALNAYASLFIPAGRRGRGTVAKAATGLIIFSVIALTVIVPLLSSADAIFAAKTGFIYDWLERLISQALLNKIVVFVILAVLLLAMLLAWGRRADYEETGKKKRAIDPVVAGIVIGGILGIYLLFIWVQFARLWVGALPFDFKETENLVKSGFWQLFFLSGINVLIYFFAYRRTGVIVQKILFAFTAASLLLLASAGYRMALYVIYYGFSYEKFFASYTVIYFALLFVWLITRLVRAGRADILKFTVFLFLWMYAAATVLPVEQFIFRANLALSARPDTRINLYEMTMLSPDVLSQARAAWSAGKLTSRALDPETGEIVIKPSDWGPWIARQEKRLQEKRWHEMTLADYLKQLMAK